MAINPYDDITENMFRCFGANDHVFRAGRSEREAADQLKEAIVTQGLSREAVKKIVSEYLLNANAAHQFIEKYISEAMDFFFPQVQNDDDAMSDTQ